MAAHGQLWPAWARAQPMRLAMSMAGPPARSSRTGALAGTPCSLTRNGAARTRLVDRPAFRSRQARCRQAAEQKNLLLRVAMKTSPQSAQSCRISRRRRARYSRWEQRLEQTGAPRPRRHRLAAAQALDRFQRHQDSRRVMVRRYGRTESYRSFATPAKGAMFGFSGHKRADVAAIAGLSNVYHGQHLPPSWGAPDNPRPNARNFARTASNLAKGPRFAFSAYHLAPTLSPSPISQPEECGDPRAGM